MKDYVMNRELLKRHCEEMCKRFGARDVPYTSASWEHRLVLELLEQTEWIPVSERLPEDGQSVLFCDNDNDIMVGYHVKGRPDTHFSQDGTYEDMKNVRAWMPLPQPYKAGD